MMDDVEVILKILRVYGLICKLIFKTIKIILILIICAIAIFIFPYIVWRVYDLFEDYIGLDIYLDRVEMLSYFMSALGVLSSTAIAIVAIRQTNKLDDLGRAPNIVISSCKGPLANDKISSYEIGSMDLDIPLYFEFFVLDKGIEEIEISDFTISRGLFVSDNGCKNILTLPSITIPDKLFPKVPFLYANTKFIVCCSVGKDISNRYFDVAFTTRCKTMEGICYQKKWSGHMIGPDSRPIPVGGKKWKRCKK